MAQFLKDILSFIQSLSMIDLILYFAVLVLIILIISLIYVVKTSDNEEEEEEQTQWMELPKTKEPISLKEIVDTIEEKPKPLVDMTAYESEQEEKAIISYDELINTSQYRPISYDKEEIIDNEVRVKKVNLEKKAKPSLLEESPKTESKLFHYEREEAFLNTLKQLNELLN